MNFMSKAMAAPQVLTATQNTAKLADYSNTVSFNYYAIFYSYVHNNKIFDFNAPLHHEIINANYDPSNRTLALQLHYTTNIKLGISTKDFVDLINKEVQLSVKFCPNFVAYTKGLFPSSFESVELLSISYSTFFVSAAYYTAPVPCITLTFSH